MWEMAFNQDKSCISLLVYLFINSFISFIFLLISIHKRKSIQIINRPCCSFYRYKSQWNKSCHSVAILHFRFPILFSISSPYRGQKSIFIILQCSKTSTPWSSWVSAVCWRSSNDTASARWDLHYCWDLFWYSGRCCVGVFIASTITIKSNWELKGRWKFEQFLR